MTIPLEKLQVDFDVRTAAASKGLSALKPQFGNIAREATVTLAKVTAFAGGITTLIGGAGLGAMLQSSYENIDALAKMSDRIGIATDQLAGLRHAAGLSGVASGKLDTSLLRMTRTIGEAVTGSKSASDAFEMIGLSAESLIALSPDLQFRAIADALNNVESQAIKNAAAYDIFGRSGQELLNTLSLGSKGLDEAQQEAVQLGKAVNRVDAAKIEMANDAVSKMRTGVSGLVDTLAIQLAPVVTAVAERFVDWLNAMDFGDSINALGFMSRATGFLADYGQTLGIIWSQLDVKVNETFGSIVGGLEALYKFSAEKTGIDALEGTAGFLENYKNDLDKLLKQKQEFLNEKWTAPDASNQVDKWFRDLEKDIEQRAKELADRGPIRIPQVYEGPILPGGDRQLAEPVNQPVAAVLRGSQEAFNSVAAFENAASMPDEQKKQTQLLGEVVTQLKEEVAVLRAMLARGDDPEALNLGGAF